MLHRFQSLLVAALILGVPGISRGEDRNERQFQECRECPIMVGIPAGTFLMGSPPNENGRFDSEGPQHVVTIKAFALGKYDITTQEFATFLKETGYKPEPCNPTLDLRWNSSAPYSAAPLKWPAVCLNWRAAQSYIAWLNGMVRSDHQNVASASGPYRLPTEAEWEYASRAGTASARWWGDPIGVGNANCNGCGSPWDNRLLADVDSFASNPFGLYGMLGNAWQWTADCWHPNYVGAPQDGSAWTEDNCEKYVIRGGSWDNLPMFVRSAARSSSEPRGAEYDNSRYTGFRVARDLP